ncbi:hypothetical protein L208DRAFT_1473248, partial [Tricholoma matsutake]
DVIVQLPEKSLILNMLFQFCHSDPHPELNDLTFDTLAELAKAAENYKVFSAISVCKISMKDALPLNVFNIFIYGAMYGHPDIYQTTPIMVLQKPLSQVLPRLPDNLLTP